MDLEIKIKHHFELLYLWLIYEFFTPVVFICMLYPIYNYFLMVSFPFERVFFSAELIPISCLLILNSSRDIEQEQRFGSLFYRLYKTKIFGQACSILFLSSYWVIKCFSLTYKYPVDSNYLIEEWVLISSWTSIFIIIFSFIYCLNIKIYIIYHLKKELLTTN